MKMLPSVGFSSMFKQRRNVDLPEPDGPMTAATSPFSKETEICLNYVLVLILTFVGKAIERKLNVND